jgi:hypothetical protein
MLEHLIFDGRDYLVEGVNLRPRTIAAFVAETDESVSVCFLGYPGVSIKTKMAQVAQYTGLPNFLSGVAAGERALKGPAGGRHLTG